MPDTECTSPPHEGFEVNVPGTTLRKIAPALRVTSKLLRAAALVGKAAGLPFLPTSLPFVNELNAEVRVWIARSLFAAAFAVRRP